MRLAQDSMRRALMCAVEVQSQLQTLLGPRLDGDAGKAFVRVEKRIEVGNAARDRAQDLGVMIHLDVLVPDVQSIRDAESSSRLTSASRREPPPPSSLGERAESNETGLAAP